jgi:hypothetical protein
MGGTSESTGKQEQQQQSTTAPYAPTQPMLQNILNKLGGMSSDPTAGQTGAANLLQSEAGGVPSFGPQGTQAVDNLFGSTTTPQQGMLSQGYGNLQNTLGKYTDPSYLDPNSNPQIRGWLDTVRNDVTNNVNDQFAAAGRDLSPANSTALGRGIAQGEAPILADQYNRNVGAQQGAAGTLYDASGKTASAITNQQQVPLQNALQGMGAAGQVPGLLTMPGQTALGAANTGAQLPWQGMGWLSALLNPIAGMGSQSQGTGTGSQSGTQTMSGADQFAKIAGGFNSLMSPFKTQGGLSFPGMG